MVFPKFEWCALQAAIILIIFTQTDGTPIGKSISGPLADIYMIWFEEQYIFNDNNIFKPYIKLWKRFRDDIYIIWNVGHDTLDCFFFGN